MANLGDFRGIRGAPEIELIDRSTRTLFHGGTKASTKTETAISHPARNQQRREESSRSGNVFSEHAPLLVDSLDAERDNSVSFRTDHGSQYTSIAAPRFGEESLHSHLNDTSIPQMSSTSKTYISNFEVNLDTDNPPTQRPVFTIINSPDPVDPVCLLFVFIFQAFVTLGLHLTELLVMVSRDEEFWRTTYSSGGYKIEYNSILAAALSWKSLVLLAFKPVIHWLYGLGISTIWGVGLVMRPASLMYMTLSFLLLALFGTGLARARPKGPQPVTYGHVQTIINLVDERQDFDSGKNGRLYWGHKFEDRRTGVCRAGTSDHVLPPIDIEKKYL